MTGLDDTRLEMRLAALEQNLETLSVERQRAVDVASEEREKAASALRDSLERAIREGDERLREHVSNQIQQIRASLESADKLELSRIDYVAEKADKQQAVANERFSAAEVAIRKAENATEIRFQGVNEFRATLSDQTKSFIPRELAEKTTDQLDKRLSDLQQWQAKIIGALVILGVLMPMLTGLAVYLLTRHGITITPAK
jgi:hypothetical protein